MDEVISHTFGIKELPNYFQELDFIQLINNIIPKGLLSFGRLFDSKDIQRAKILAIQNENNVVLEFDLGKCKRIGSECS